jgi:hypothetical protein
MVSGFATALLIFNLVMAILIAATILNWIPLRIYRDFLYGLHYTIGITAPTDRQLRWTLVVWLISLLVIVDGMVLLLQFVR